MRFMLLFKLNSIHQFTRQIFSPIKLYNYFNNLYFTYYCNCTNLAFNLNYSPTWTYFCSISHSIVILLILGLNGKEPNPSWRGIFEAYRNPRQTQRGRFRTLCFFCFLRWNILFYLFCFDFLLRSHIQSTHFLYSFPNLLNLLLSLYSFLFYFRKFLFLFIILCLPISINCHRSIFNSISCFTGHLSILLGSV